MVEMTVPQAIREFDEFATFICRDKEVLREFLLDDKYRVRVSYRDDGICFEIGYPSDNWEIK